MSNNTAYQKSTCKHCKKKFTPEYRNRYHQEFCNKPACRRASKYHSQRKWLAKNPGFFCGHEHVIRVQIWRKEKGRGRGRMIFRMVLELLVFRRKGRKDIVKVVKRDGDGHVLQDICELNNAIDTRVILRLVQALQDFIDQILPRTYSAPQKDKKVRNGRGKRCQKLKVSRPACLRRSRNSITRRWRIRRKR